MTELRTLKEQSAAVLQDIRAHMRGIHGVDPETSRKCPRNPLWHTAICHGTYPCDYLDRLGAERERLADAIQEEYGAAIERAEKGGNE